MSEHSDLKKIGHLYQTDKIDHGYLEIYENYFNKLQNKNLTILEIGIADGKSLLMWSDYFKNSKIIGIDIHNTASTTTNMANLRSSFTIITSIFMIAFIFTVIPY